MTQATPPTDHRSPPPDPDLCLCRAYASRPNQKGGTLIAEGVTDLAEHERRMRIDAYRPGRCPRCGDVCHGHQQRSRLLLGELQISTDVAIYRCADRERCGAVWRVLPALLARHLWRAWRTVERSVSETAVGDPDERPGVAVTEVPKRTLQRWRARLATSAALIVAVLATAADVPEHAAVVERAGYSASRAELVEIVTQEIGGRHGRLAAIVHRLAPGVRLM